MGLPKIRRLTVVIVSAAAGLMAISTGSAQPSEMPDACRLVSRDIVGAAFGVSVGEGTARVHNGVVTSCIFPAKGGGSIAILFRRNPGRAWMEEQQNRMRQGVRYGSFQPSAGLGDQAFQLDMRAAICVFQADSYLQVSVWRAGSAATIFTGAETLARQVLTRLDLPKQAKLQGLVGTR